MERGKLLKIMGVFIILSVFISASYAADPTEISTGDDSGQDVVDPGTDLMILVWMRIQWTTQ